MIYKKGESSFAFLRTHVINASVWDRSTAALSQIFSHTSYEYRNQANWLDEKASINQSNVWLMQSKSCQTSSFAGPNKRRFIPTPMSFSPVDVESIRTWPRSRLSSADWEEPVPAWRHSGGCRRGTRYVPGVHSGQTDAANRWISFDECLTFAPSHLQGYGRTYY